MFTFKLGQDGSQTVYALEGSLTAGTVGELREQVKSAINDGALSLVFEMSAVSAVDSAGVGLFAAVFNTINRKKGSMKVVGLSEELYRFFIALRLNAHFSVEERKP